MINPICSRVSILPGHLTDTQTQALRKRSSGLPLNPGMGISSTFSIGRLTLEYSAISPGNQSLGSNKWRTDLACEVFFAERVPDGEVAISRLTENQFPLTGTHAVPGSGNPKIDLRKGFPLGDGSGDENGALEEAGFP